MKVLKVNTNAYSFHDVLKPIPWDTVTTHPISPCGSQINIRHKKITIKVFDKDIFITGICTELSSDIVHLDGIFYGVHSHQLVNIEQAEIRREATVVLSEYEAALIVSALMKSPYTNGAEVKLITELHKAFNDGMNVTEWLKSAPSFNR